MSYTPQPVWETLTGMAEMDEHSAQQFIPKLTELLDRDTPDDNEQFAAVQEEIMDVFQKITALQANAAGIRLILKTADRSES